MVWYEDGGDYIGDFSAQEEGQYELSYRGALTSTACLEDRQRFPFGRRSFKLHGAPAVIVAENRI